MSIKNTNISKLRTLQNKCLRMIANTNPREKNLNIHNRLEIPSIDKEIFDRTKKFFETQSNDIPEI